MYSAKNETETNELNSVSQLIGANESNFKGKKNLAQFF